MIKGLKPAISYVRDQDATTVPARYMSKTGSLNQTPIHSCFSDLSDFPEFNESSVPFRKNCIAFPKNT